MLECLAHAFEKGKLRRRLAHSDLHINRCRLLMQGKESVGVEVKPKPLLTDPNDVIIKVCIIIVLPVC